MARCALVNLIFWIYNCDSIQTGKGALTRYLSVLILHVHLATFMFLKYYFSSSNFPPQRNIIMEGESEARAGQELRAFRKGLKPITWIGPFLGTFPTNSLLAKSQNDSKRCCCCLLLFSTIIFIVVLFHNSLLVCKYFQFQNFTGTNFMGRISEWIHIMYAGAILFSYGYNILACIRLKPQTLLASFQSTIGQLGNGSLGKRAGFTFPVFCWIAAILCLVLGVSENILFDLQTVQRDSNVKVKTSVACNKQSVLCRYYGNHLSHWSAIFPSYHPGLVIFLWVFVNLANTGWLFMDALVVVLCHTLRISFWELGNRIRVKLELIDKKAALWNWNRLSKIAVGGGGIGQLDSMPSPSSDWNQIFSHFRLLVKLTRATEKYIGPLIISSYVCLSQILIILFSWVAPYVELSIMTSNTGHIYYSLVYFIFRVGTLTHFASEVYQSSHDILTTLEESSSIPHAQLERIERKLGRNPVGIRLFGTFLITRHTFLSMTGFIFTTEIILLQMTNAIHNNTRPINR